MIYRADIDGLRAIAVLVVIFFHFGIPGLSGGFIGVDIFFVLSGYLIGSIILKQLQEESFSFVGFYFRRIRRLMPVFAVVMLVSFLLAYWLMLPGELKKFGQSLIAATSYLSNVFFYRETGYFDSGAHLKPLLHTWSLSVEEQFYIIFPFLAWLVFRINRRWILLSMGFLTLASLFASIIYLPENNSAVFYLYPFRAWEMFCGVVLAASKLPKINNRLYQSALALIGFVLIALPVIFYNEKTPFPGMTAIWPCLGTLILLYVGESKHTVFSSWLAHPVPVFIGKISYSLYLWHWPFYVFYTYGKLGPLNSVEILLLTAATFLAAILSWRYIEIPFRQGRVLFSKKTFPLFASASLSSLLLIALGVYLHVSQGAPQRLSPQAANFAEAAGDLFGDFTNCYESDNEILPMVSYCEIQSPLNSLEYTLMWGDSHGGAYKRGYQQQVTDRQSPALIAWTGGCPPVFGIDKDESVSPRSIDRECRIRNASIRTLLDKDRRIDQIVLIGRWTYYLRGQGIGTDVHNTIQLWDEHGKPGDIDNQAQFFLSKFEDTVRTLNELGYIPYVVEQPPEFANYVSRYLAAGLIRDDKDVINKLDALTTIPYAEVYDQQKMIQNLFTRLEQQGHIHIIKTHPFFCNKETCSLMLDGKPVYFDNNHVSSYGAQQISAMFDPLFTLPSTFSPRKKDTPQ